MIAGLELVRPGACVTSSFQAEDMVVLHMLQRTLPKIPVLFLDTVHHFADTYKYRDELAERWGLNLINLRANEPSPGLWQTSTDACCARHKVGPLFSAALVFSAALLVSAARWVRPCISVLPRGSLARPNVREK